MKNRTNTRWLTQLALLVAVLLVMNYTPLGYLQVGPLSMSLLTIPVAIGAMTLGPVAGAILGGVFGTTSFVSALRTPSVMSAAMLQASPVGTFITCFVARVPEVIGEKDKNQDTHAQPRGERNGQCDDEYALVSGEHLRRDKALIGAEEAAEHSDPDEQQQHRR